MYRQMPPPFDPHNMPPPGRGVRPSVHGPMMGEPFFDHMSAPPNGFFNHPFHPEPPHGHGGVHDYRGGGGSRGESRGAYFNNMSDYHMPPNFSNEPAAANCQLSSSDGMMSGGNYSLPPDGQIYPDPHAHQSLSCRYAT